MGIRIQPLDIEVPPENPFKYDLVGREKRVEELTRMVRNIEGPCVLALDAGWSTGKTTFIRIWDQYLRNEGFPVVRINAWDTDFSGDPFVSLVSGLTEGLEDYTEETITDKIKRLNTTAIKVLQKTIPDLVKVAAGQIPIVGPSIDGVLGSLASHLLSRHPKAAEAIHEFRSDLRDMARSACEHTGKSPLVVFIDELDRCRPSYAIELLKVAKHLFAVDKVVLCWRSIGDSWSTRFGQFMAMVSTPTGISKGYSTSTFICLTPIWLGSLMR